MAPIHLSVPFNSTLPQPHCTLLHTLHNAHTAMCSLYTLHTYYTCCQKTLNYHSLIGSAPYPSTMHILHCRCCYCTYCTHCNTNIAHIADCIPQSLQCNSLYQNPTPTTMQICALWNIIPQCTYCNRYIVTYWIEHCSPIHLHTACYCSHNAMHCCMYCIIAHCTVSHNARN